MHITDPTPDPEARPTMQIRGLNLWYGEKQALRDVSFDLMPREILAFIGPSGCGKSTALKVLNRMHDNVRGVRITGSVLMHGTDVYGEAVDPPAHRRRFGWVAQKPNPFFTSIWENVAYGPHIHGLMATHADMAAHVEDCLRRAHLWDEVKDHLHDRMGTDLSGGQQQRLCIARALSTQPEVLLMDEPTGSIDPIATTRIEELIVELRANHSIVIITHSMMEARRISDRVAYFHMGEVLEIGPTAEVFDHPASAEAQRFISGQFG